MVADFSVMEISLNEIAGSLGVGLSSTISFLQLASNDSTTIASVKNNLFIFTVLTISDKNIKKGGKNFFPP